MALLLGVLGLYGVIAYSVSQRTRELGVRLALGAQRSSVYRLILKDASVVIAVGLGAGLICSLVAASLIRNLLFDTVPVGRSDARWRGRPARRFSIPGELRSGTPRRVGEPDHGTARGVVGRCVGGA